MKKHNAKLTPLISDWDAIHIDGFGQGDVLNSSSIGSFEFADGTSLSTTELLARGFDAESQLRRLRTCVQHLHKAANDTFFHKAGRRVAA